VIDLASDLRFLLGDVPGSALVQCGAESGYGLKIEASKLAEHRFGNLDFQATETVLVYDPTQMPSVAKGVSLMIGGLPFNVVKPVKRREDGSALAVVVAS